MSIHSTGQAVKKVSCIAGRNGNLCNSYGEELAIPKIIPFTVCPSTQQSDLLEFTLKIHFQQDEKKYAQGYWSQHYLNYTISEPT